MSGLPPKPAMPGTLRNFKDSLDNDSGKSLPPVKPPTLEKPPQSRSMLVNTGRPASSLDLKQQGISPSNRANLKKSKPSSNSGTLRGKSGIPNNTDSLRDGRTGSLSNSGTLRGKSGVPNENGTLRGKSGVPNENGTLRGKSGVPNSGTLRGRSGVPYDSGSLRGGVADVALRTKSSVPDASKHMSLHADSYLRTKTPPQSQFGNNSAPVLDFGEDDELDLPVGSSHLSGGSGSGYDYPSYSSGSSQKSVGISLGKSLMDSSNRNNPPGPPMTNIDFGEDEMEDPMGPPPSKQFSLPLPPPSLHGGPEELSESSSEDLYEVKPPQMSNGMLMKPSGLDASYSDSDMGNLYAISGPTGSEDYSDSLGEGTTQQQPGVIGARKDDAATTALNTLFMIRDRTIDASKVIAKHASDVAETAGLIESSKARSYVKKIFEQLKQNDPTLIDVPLASCGLGKGKIRELIQCLQNNTVVRKLDLSNRGLKDPENTMNTLTKRLAENTHITHVDVRNNGCGMRAAISIETLLKINLNITRFDIQERVFQAYDRASLARCLQSIQWLLNSNYSYQAFKFGKSTSLVLSGRNYKQLVARLLDGASRVQYFDISYNELETFPIMIEEMSQVQQFIASHNLLNSIPGPAIVNFDRLMKLDLSHNRLVSLPDEICELVNVQELQCSNNMIEDIPEMLRLMQSLKRVDFSNNRISKLPTELSNLSHLEIFLIHSNQLLTLPDSLFFIGSLRILNLGNNRLVSLPEETPNLQNLEALELSNNQLVQIPAYFGSFLNMRRMNLSNNRLSELPEEFVRMKNMEYLNLANNLLTKLPEQFGNLWRLVEFHAENNKLVVLPKTLQFLKYLRVLDLTNNRLKNLDHFLCTLVSLNTLKLYRNEPLKGMPSDILEKAERYEKSEKEEKRQEGEQMTLDFVRQLPKVPIHVHRVKLMIIGKKGTGKSCLLQALQIKSSKSRSRNKKLVEPQPTEGIRVANLKFRDTQLCAWDFSGDEQYYTTHQMFLSQRAIYLLVCNMMDPESEDVRIEQWLEMITRKVGDQVPVVIVGTHLDDKACNAKHRKTFWNRIKANIGSRFTNVVGYEGISAQFNKKTDAVLERVLKIATNRYPPVQVMRGYQYLEERIYLLNRLMKTPMTSFKRFSEEIMACGITADSVKEAMKFFNDTGILVYFGDICPTLVFLQPQWIVELISSFNQIKKFANRGMVNRSEFTSIWDPEKYPEKYHEYILMLLERSDLLMRLKEQGKIFFPELLEEEQTPSLATLHMMWAPGYEMEEPEFRRTLHYQFAPATLFPRIVGKVVYTLGWEIQNYWKNGSILSNSNGSGAFVKLDPVDKNLQITIRGEHAGADLIQILVTIDQLNASLGLTDVESFVPCTHCLLLEEDAKPYLFPIHEFRAALDENKEYVLCGGEVAVKLRALLPNGTL